MRSRSPCSPIEQIAWSSCHRRVNLSRKARWYLEWRHSLPCKTKLIDNLLQHQIRAAVDLRERRMSHSKMMTWKVAPRCRMDGGCRDTVRRVPSDQCAWNGTPSRMLYCCSDSISLALAMWEKSAMERYADGRMTTIDLPTSSVAIYVTNTSKPISLGKMPDCKRHERAWTPFCSRGMTEWPASILIFFIWWKGNGTKKCRKYT